MSLDVLVVDDEQDIRDLISDILVDDGYKPRLASNSSSAIEAIDERLPSAVVLDIWLQGSELDGLGILESVKRKHPNLPVIMISGHGNIETAINSIKLGAYDFIEKPFKEDRLLLLLRRAIEAAKLKEENDQLRLHGAYESQLIGDSSAVIQLKNIIEKVSQTESRVLISGPAGCGKEVVARAIHERSNRSNNRFVFLNAASILPDNVESELFGKEDAIVSEGERKVGTFERAHGGTLFIDEVADMPLGTQGKLLRILQEKSFERTGGNRRVEVDVRVIAATSKDLQQEIAEGRFREDLFYRLNVVPIQVPSLKQRRADIKPLVEHFIAVCSESLGVAPKEINDSAMASLEAYHWPGNIRQLRNVIEHLLIMSADDSDDMIGPDALPPDILSVNPVNLRPENNSDIMGLPLRAARETFEKQYLTAQLDRFGGNISRTATFIGMERSAFHRKIKLLNIRGNEEVVGEKV